MSSSVCRAPARPDAAIASLTRPSVGQSHDAPALGGFQEQHDLDDRMAPGLDQQADQARMASPARGLSSAPSTTPRIRRLCLGQERFKNDRRKVFQIRAMFSGGISGPGRASRRQRARHQAPDR